MWSTFVDVSRVFVVTGPKPVACHRAVHGSSFILIGYQATLYRIFYSSNALKRSQTPPSRPFILKLWIALPIFIGQINRTKCKYRFYDLKFVFELVKRELITQNENFRSSFIENRIIIPLHLVLYYPKLLLPQKVHFLF